MINNDTLTTVIFVTTMIVAGVALGLGVAYWAGWDADHWDRPKRKKK